MANQLKHAELVELARTWLVRQRCAIVVTELASCGETPDALGWYGYHSTLIECKASREDFLRDKKKHYRHPKAKALGQHRYYMAPRGLLNVDELPEAWGLIIVNESGRTRTVKKSGRHGTWREGELMIMMSLVRRIGQDAPKGVSIKFYTHENKSTATASVSQDTDTDTDTELDKLIVKTDTMSQTDCEKIFSRADDKEDCYVPQPKDFVRGSKPSALFKDVRKLLSCEEPTPPENIDYPTW